ncbi:hypothetical protein H920_05624 [Fukomys damarensis]|uniref:Uncharacterized protein n=1 Tax=Fukomys damarensis TaxID=885580 RepID=A0A091DRA2_FUKDA|nr:hypothetical protein H920_05624 [Fukomys damarensis]
MLGAGPRSCIRDLLSWGHRGVLQGATAPGADKALLDASGLAPRPTSSSAPSFLLPGTLLEGENNQQARNGVAKPEASMTLSHLDHQDSPPGPHLDTTLWPKTSA